MLSVRGLKRKGKTDEEVAEILANNILARAQANKVKRLTYIIG